MYFFTLGGAGRPSAVCVKNTETKGLKCTLLGDSSAMIILLEDCALNSPSLDERVSSPLWGTSHPGSQHVCGDDWGLWAWMR